MPSIQLNIENMSNLAQDNCPIHTPRSVRQCYETSNIHIIDWPSKSPDINIVENIWKMLSDIVYDGNQPRSIKELRQKVHDAADVINNEKRCVILNM